MEKRYSAIKITLLVLKILLGAVFCTSAVLKLLTIDKFEMYIFSFGFLSLNLSFAVARLCIAFELFLGIGLMANVYNKFFNTITLLTLVGFTIFLVYVLAIGRSDNCQCFGDFVFFSPWQSIIKNVVLIALVLLVFTVPSFRWHPHWLWILAVGVATLATVSLVSPPDNILFGEGGKNGAVSQEKLDKYIASDSLLYSKIGEGKKLVCFFSPACKYCQLTAQKVSSIVQRNSIPDTNVLYVFRGEHRPTQAEKFFAKTNTPPVDYVFVNANNFNAITYSAVPVVTFVKNGEVEKTFHYRNITEKAVVDFFAND